MHLPSSDEYRLILPGAASGWIQSRLGYTNFFIWVILPLRRWFSALHSHSRRPASAPTHIAEAQTVRSTIHTETSPIGGINMIERYKPKPQEPAFARLTRD